MKYEIIFAALIILLMGLIVILVPKEEIRSGIIIEKGKYQRVQYLFQDDRIDTELDNNNYIIVRDNKNGKEFKIIGFDQYVVGDAIELLREGNYFTARYSILGDQSM